MEEYIRTNFKYIYYVDMEYNRHRLDEKIVYAYELNEKVKRRPDIIVHTRRENIQGIAPNYLIIEAKKSKFSETDKKKIKAFMEDPQYQYRFGAQIIYHELVHPTIILYYKQKGEVKEKILS